MNSSRNATLCLLAMMSLAPWCPSQVPDDRDPWKATPPNVLDAISLNHALDWLCRAVAGVTTLNPPESDAVEDCVANAKLDIEKALNGRPEGPDENGDERSPRPLVLVEHGTKWGQTAKLGAYTVPEELGGTASMPSSKSTEKVGVGHERVVISEHSMLEPPWMLSSLLAHEGKRLSQPGGFANVNSKTKPEKKKMAEGEEKAYCTNIAVVRSNFRHFFDLLNELPASELTSPRGVYLRAQMAALSARLRLLMGRKERAKDIKEKNCA